MHFAWIVGLLASLTIVPAARAGWVQHNEPSLGFQATFPASPKREETTESGVKMVTFSGVKNGIMCLIIAADYPYVINPDEETVASRDNFVKGVGATLGTSNRIKFPRGSAQLEAMRFDADNQKYWFRSMIVIEGSRAYQIAGGVPKPDGDTAELDACIGGLVLTTSSAEPPQAQRRGAGTGFFVSSNGTLATNEHVVRGCSRMEAVGYGETELIRSDVTNDLALLRLKSGMTVPYAKVRLAQVRVGETVIVVGYPLSRILNNSVNVTNGIVSSLSGIGGDGRHVQITAPVQPGNSGGPVLDTTGQVVGVVSSKLDDIVALKVSGSIPQGVNFAVKTTLLKLLAEAAHVPLTSGDRETRLDTTTIADAATKYTVQLACMRP